MLFNSFAFLVLFSLTFFIYYLPAFWQLQIVILVISSLIFYSWDSPPLLVLLLLSIFINGLTSFQIASASRRKKITWLLLGLSFNLLILSFFKYGALIANLFSINLAASEDSIFTFLLRLPLPIAIGTAAAFGYTLPQNFNFPYISRSLSEFWKRWHISLSSWLKDYLYIPLGGNRKGRLRTYVNLMIVMVLGGLWHGASWSYAVWGAFNGVGLILERLFNEQVQTRLNNSLPIWLEFVCELIKIVLIFSFVSIGWLLFKLPDFGQALDFLNTMSHNLRLPTNQAVTNPVIIFSVPVIVYHLLNLPIIKTLSKEYCSKLNVTLWNLCRDLAFGGMVAMIILNSGTSNEFIYFQF